MSRLFEDFQKKNTGKFVSFESLVPKVSKVTSKTLPKDLVIAIPLKSNSDKRVELDDNFVKVIEYEYAVKYLELIGVSPTPKMISELLKNHPLSSCELSSGWSKTGWLADVIYIHLCPKSKSGLKAKNSIFDDTTDGFSKKGSLDLKKMETLPKSFSQPNLHPSQNYTKPSLDNLKIQVESYNLQKPDDKSLEAKKKEVKY
jgi:hypothetical protein